jgi:hypothetical protein
MSKTDSSKNLNCKPQGGDAGEAEFLATTAKEAFRELAHIENHLERTKAPSNLRNRTIDLRCCIRELHAAAQRNRPTAGSDGGQAALDDEIARLRRKLDNMPIHLHSARLSIAVEIDRLKAKRDQAAQPCREGDRGGDVPDGWKQALHAAVSALYFDDGSKFRAALGTVIRHLDPAIAGDVLCNPKTAFDKTSAMIAPAPTVREGCGSKTKEGE